MADPLSLRGFPVDDEAVPYGYAQAGPARVGGPPERAVAGALVPPWAAPPGRSPVPPAPQPIITNACPGAASVPGALYGTPSADPDGPGLFPAGALAFAAYPRRRRLPVYRDPPHCCRECD